MAKEKESVKLAGVRSVTKNFRLSFPHLAKPHLAPKSKDPKFSIVMLFPKDGEGYKHAKSLLTKAAIEQWGPANKWPKIQWPWKDGDAEEGKKGYAGHFAIAASTGEDYPPSCIDREGGDMMNIQRDMYAGCYARAEVTAKAIPDVGGKNFVKFYLNGVQFIRDGEKLGGRDSRSAFAASEIDDDDDDGGGDDDDGDDGYGV